jgi:hypothetical protein
MKILDRRKIEPFHLMAGDSLIVMHTENKTGQVGLFGRIKTTTKELARTTVTPTQAMTVDEAVLIETEFEGRRALGGLVLEKEKKETP